MSEQHRWDTRYQDRGIEEGSPATVLVENCHLLPKSGQALDLACGLGANAILLAQHGLQSFAWDRSEVAIAKLHEWGQKHSLPLNAEVHDVELDPPEPNRFDVIVVAHFLERRLAGPLMKALRPGGLLFYQTFTRTRVTETGPQREQFRLADNELLQLFAPLRLVVYREEGRIGDLSRGFRDRAQFIAYKPDSCGDDLG